MAKHSKMVTFLKITFKEFTKKRNINVIVVIRRTGFIILRGTLKGLMAIQFIALPPKFLISAIVKRL